MDVRMPPLKTDRLLIRPFTDDDVAAVRSVLGAEGADGGDDRIERYVRHGALNAGVLADMTQPPLGDRAVVLRETGELIGIVGFPPAFAPFDQLRPMDDGRAAEHPPAPYRIEIGLYYEVRPDHRGRGYATEAARALVDFAFTELQLGRIVATTERDNLASQAVMRHLGMRLYENAQPEPSWFQLAGILENPWGQERRRRDA